MSACDPLADVPIGSLLVPSGSRHSVRNGLARRRVLSARLLTIRMLQENGAVLVGVNCISATLYGSLKRNGSRTEAALR